MIVVDAHIDTAQRMLDGPDDIARRLPDGHVDIPRLLEGGVTAAFFAIWVDDRYGPGTAFAHAVAVMGIEHVGLGSDFDGVGVLPPPLKDATSLPLVAAALGARGFGDSDVRKICGENFLRVLQFRSVMPSLEVPRE